MGEQRIRPDLPHEMDCRVCGMRLHRQPPDGWPFVDEHDRTHTLSPGPDHTGTPQPFRLTEGGRQIVRFGRYAYIWDGEEPLALGDRCLLPGNWLVAQPAEAEVTGFGTAYEGTLSHVVRLITRAERSDPPSGG